MTRTAAVALWVLMGMALTTGQVRADITYTFDLSAGASGSITTDGQTGTLSAGDILDWQINIKGLVFSGSGAGTAVGVSATLSALELDTTQISSTFLLQQDGQNFINWTVATSLQPHEPAELIFFGEASNGIPPKFASFNSTVHIDDSTATIATVASVPEPSTAALGVLGAVAFIAHGWSRRRAQRRQGAGGQPQPIG